MSKTNVATGHLLALFTIVIWGTTFISTKVLLRSFTPIEILFLRFALGYAALWLACPRVLRVTDKRQETYFAAAGLFGVTLYFLFENIALTYTMASNASVVLSIAPFFTALLAGRFLKKEKPRPVFFVGFACAITGIFLISLNGSTAFSLNPLGDVLALLAAAVWAVYSILVRKIGAFSIDPIQTTRRTFFYGLLFMIPALFWMDFSPDPAALVRPENLFNLLFLGLLASAVCFVTWGRAVGILGAVKTSVYIYLNPIVTIFAAAVVLHEQITAMAACGTALALAGLFLSEARLKKRSRRSGPQDVDRTKNNAG